MSKKDAPITRVRVVLPFLLHYAENGGDVHDLLTELGAPLDLMSTPDGVISSQLIHQIVNEVGARLDDNFIGARIGKEWADSDGPPFKNAKAGSKYLGQLFNSLVADFSSESAAGSYTINVDQDFAVFSGGRNFTPDYPTKHPDATFASFLVCLLKNWLADDWEPKEALVLVDDPSGIPSWIIATSSVMRGRKNAVSIRFPALWMNLEKSPAGTVSSTKRSGSDAIDADRLTALRTYVVEHLNSSNASVEGAAGRCGLSVRALQRMLKDRGTSFRKLTSELRIETAAELLKSSDLPVVGIAQEVGFTSSSSLAKAFRKRMGVSPEEFRSDRADVRPRSQ